MFVPKPVIVSVALPIDLERAAVVKLAGSGALSGLAVSITEQLP